MPSCAFDKCRSHTRKDHKADGVTFHALPVEESTKLKWIAILRKQRREYDWVPTPHTRVCSMHFRPEVKYTTSKGYTRIKKTAVPFFRREYGPSRVKLVKTEVSERPERNTEGGSSSAVKESDSESDDPLQIARRDSSSGLSDIGSSDLEGALDTPNVISLKKKLRETEQTNEDLKKQMRKNEVICNDHIKQIKLLQKAHRRIGEKHETLKKVLTNLKRKLLKRNSIFDANGGSDDEESHSS